MYNRSACPELEVNAFDPTVGAEAEALTSEEIRVGSVTMVVGCFKRDVKMIQWSAE